MMNDPIGNAALAAAEGHDGWPTPAAVWQVGEDDVIVPGDGELMLDGMVICGWSL